MRARLAHVASGQESIESIIRDDIDRLHDANARYDFLSAEAHDAIDRARALDRLGPDGRGPLAGITFTVKDWIEARCLPAGTSFGAPLERIARRDATVVERLRRAGAILLGVTRAVGDADRAPGPLNPRAPDHSPGASSRGEAVAVASGASMVGLGSDSGGSVRWPAHCCGVVGYKPSSGRVPSTGHVPPIIGLTDPRTVIGPLVRRVVDLEPLFGLLDGHDGIDATVFGWSPPVIKPLAELRIAVFDHFDGAVPDADTARQFRAAVARLTALGATVEAVVPPLIDTAFEITQAYWRRPESMSTTRWAPAYSSSLSADAAEESLFHWDRLRRSFFGFMREYHAVVCPVAATPAPPLANDYRVSAEDYRYTLPFSLTGQPVISVPVGSSADGRPINLQVAGRIHGDEQLVPIAAAIEVAS